MPKNQAPQVPKYRLHKATKQAVVTINRHDYYLGKHGTKRLGEILEAGQRAPLRHGGESPSVLAHVGSRLAARPSDKLTVLEAADKFREYVEARHKPVEHAHYRGMLKVLLSIFQ